MIELLLTLLFYGLPLSLVLLVVLVPLHVAQVLERMEKEEIAKRESKVSVKSADK